jgi:LPS-assembly lipoprotein
VPAAGWALAGLAALALAGCQLSPVYSGGAQGIAAATLAQVSVAPIPDRAGFLLREELVRRIGEPAPGQARYRLEVALDDQLTGFGLRGGTAAVSRERRTLRARWRLIDTTTDAVVLDAASGSDAGIDVVASSEFAVVAAEQSALERLAAELADQMTARIALWARQRGAGAER